MQLKESNINVEKLNEKADKLGKTTPLITNEHISQVIINSKKNIARNVLNRYSDLAKLSSKTGFINHEIESIFDNFFIIETTIFDIISSFKKKDFKRFPLVERSKDEIYFRLYFILREYVHENKGVVDKESILSFISKYQYHSPFSIRELNAIPIMIRFILVEDFGELIIKAEGIIREYDQAEKTYLYIAKSAKKASWNPSKITLYLANTYGTIPINLGIHLIDRLNQDGQKMRHIIKWIRLNLEKQGLLYNVISHTEEGYRSEQFSHISNIIESLHWLNQIRWDTIAEEVNVVDAILLNDPNKTFSILDSDTKNNYRNVISHIAERVSIHEAEVARVILHLANQQYSKNNNLFYKCHVGYYILDLDGRLLLEKEIRYTPTKLESLYRIVLAHPSRTYLGMISIISIILLVFVIYILNFPTQSFLLVILEILAYSMISIEIGIHISNVILLRILPVRRLSHLNLKEDIGINNRTCVVIPSMIRSERSISELIEKLESKYVGNPQKNIYYSLLLDFPDSLSENLDTDKSIIKFIENKIQELNNRYSKDEKLFFALIRRRIWNEKEKVFMAWERKRGKLREFNELLRGKKTSYIVTNGAENLLNIKYIITLDEDTELPHDIARKLIGTISHPLNMPFMDAKGRIIRGYGIIQPRVSTRLSIASHSLFTRLYSNSSGIDSYSGPVSDIYQDLFDNALFFGKGIYDIDAIESSMKGKIPDNTVLSHDLLEGIYARTGYASDIVLFDGFPKYYHEFIVRLERWIRGDWQIIGWLSGRFGQNKYGVPIERFAIIDRFKIFDNLRRSLVPVFSIIALLIGYKTDISLEITTIFIVIALMSPYALPFIASLFYPNKSFWKIRVKKWIDDILTLLIHTILRIFFTLEQSIISVWAILRTIGRLYITRRKLLQWKISHDISNTFKGKLFEYYYAMRFSVLLSIIFLIYINIYETNDQWMSVWCIVWIIAPLIAFLISLQTDRKEKINKFDRLFIRGMAYRNALFFIDNAKPETNWLIPDHIQEFPKIIGENRTVTSPTNIGMHIVSLIVSYELGYISILRYSDRIQNLFISLNRLQRYEGHFLNWYDIYSLESLTPAYVSSVDSANLLLALITAEKSYSKMEDQSIINSSIIKGLNDASRELLYDIENIYKISSRPIKRHYSVLKREVGELVLELEINGCLLPIEYIKYLSKIHKKITHIIGIIKSISASNPQPGRALLLLNIQSIIILVEEQMTSIQTLLPYLRHIDHSVELYATHDANVLNMVHKIESEAISGKTLKVISEEMPYNIKSLNFENTVNESVLSEDSKSILIDWYNRLMSDIESGSKKALEILQVFSNIAKDTNKYINEANFLFLYNSEKELFHIGYNVSFNRLDNSCYNFMASESNSISFVAILKGQVPQKHWFYLSRKLVRAGNNISLVSWGGSLFEYLTSLIFFSVHKESLLGATARSAINIHIEHANKNNTIWGMGESAYANIDSSNHYQYQVFGSAKIGLKRNLNDFLVVAPYVSALSLPIFPKRSIENLKLYFKENMLGRYGFYDALDYLDKNGNRLKKPVPVKIYYAHHQGFVLCSFFNSISNGKLQNLFHSHPMVKSLEHLFEEKMPNTPIAEPLSIPVKTTLPHTSYIRETGFESKRFIPNRTSLAHHAFISNSDYSLSISQNGTSGSYYRGIAITRPSTDIHNNKGFAMYIRNNTNNNKYSIVPNHNNSQVFSLNKNNKKKVIFQENKVEFLDQIDNLEINLSITADQFKPISVRELNITNLGKEIMSLDIVNYGELSLALENQIFHHPHFNHLLIRSETINNGAGILFSRPHPNDNTKYIYVAYIIIRSIFDKKLIFISSTRKSAYNGFDSFDPFRVFDRKLSKNNVVDYPIDPAFTIGTTIKINPNENIIISYLEIVSESKVEILYLIKKYSQQRTVLSITSEAITTSIKITQNLGISQEQSVIFQEIASLVMAQLQNKINNDFIPTEPIVLSLWKMGISGDYPLALFSIYDIADIPTVRQIIQCFVYWKWKGISIDIVILNNRPSSYMKILDDEVDFLIRQARENVSGWTKSTIYQVKVDHISNDDKLSLISSARFIMDVKDGIFSDIIKNYYKKSSNSEFTNRKRLHIRSKQLLHSNLISPIDSINNLDFYNSWGGFDPITGEYIMTISSVQMPPKVWSHIITNNKFGTLITESGATYTWSRDSYDNRLTELSNDLLNYRSGETIYIRDNSSGSYWNPTPFPVKTGAPFIVKYGFGYASYTHTYQHIVSELTVFVPEQSSSKINLLKLTNTSTTERTFTIYHVIKPIMGVISDHTADHLRSEYNVDNRMIHFSNSFRNQMINRTGFISFGDTFGEINMTNNGNEFFGKFGSYESPNALKFEALSNEIIKGKENNITISIDIKLMPGETKSIPIIIGEGGDIDEAINENHKWSNVDACEKELETVKKSWKDKLEVVQVKTSDKSIDYLSNGWLLYQSISSRLNGKTGFYQPSGAYGFRDQLQDISALIWSDSERVRKFILLACSRQFIEGDPLTWWHEYNMFGMRTVLSDHQLWLAHTVYEYIDATGDIEILNESVPFLEGPQLNFENRKSWTGIPNISNQSATVYEHAMRAINKSLVFGDHGLPLMGHSDWNDGLSSVGQNGHGESVWIGWFLVKLIDRSMKYMVERDDQIRIKVFSEIRDNLIIALDEKAWDGKWYRRAFFDNGTPLGSHNLKEFKIDSLAQSWSVLSGAGNREKTIIAHKSMNKYLLKKDYFALIDPPLQTGSVRPGYIQDYPPGIRENGAQYNHAAIWSIQSYMALNDRENYSHILDLINPIKRSSSAKLANHYGIEPYVIASDIYGDSHAGEGGWSWYTGSASLLYRTIIEHAFGVRRFADSLSISPKIPNSWTNPKIIIKKGKAIYEIVIDTNKGRDSVSECTIDNNVVDINKVPFIDDGKKHEIKIILH